MMTGLLTAALIVGGALVAWHMWLVYKSGGMSKVPMCPCGHAASWHAVEGGAGYGVYRGCQSKHTNTLKSDAFGYCPCPSSRADVMAQADAGVSA